MKSCENFVTSDSEYYIYSPSLTAHDMYFYPLHIGNFIYEPGYSLNRDSFDSFLIIYVKNGQLSVTHDNKTEIAHKASFVLLDCYNPHSYCCDVKCETIWCHFDGIIARKYYKSIVSRLGNIITLPHPDIVLNKLDSIYDIFHNHSIIKEPLISKYLNDILTSFLLFSPESIDNSNDSTISEDIILYITNHFTENITISDLAYIAKLSPFHFIRTFKKETGLTPHEYIINTRINNAKYLLKNSSNSVKSICFETGFSCESVFCNSFKKNVGLTPAQYRNSCKTL
ncbi:MAG: AraC family transcriptional regulator [Clostridium sp.]|nr:AraC family transcriptional regulator [Clostridium sp.]